MISGRPSGNRPTTLSQASRDTVAHPAGGRARPAGSARACRGDRRKRRGRPPGRSPPRPGCWRTPPAPSAAGPAGASRSTSRAGNAAWSMAPWRLRWKLFTASAKDTPACIRHSSSKRVVKSAITSPIRGSSACRSNNGTLRRNSALSLQRARTSAKVQPNTLDKVTPCCAARRSRRRLSPAESWNARRRVRGWRMLSGAQANGRAGASGKRGRRSSQ